ncbi:hypothetical protein LEN26_019005 [Aphanomyces euteiches]|nr:hypothetical protein LEN26_019005 [Aphanomyces euteiches]
MDRELFVDVQGDGDAILEDLPPVEKTPVAPTVAMSFVYDAVEHKAVSGIIHLQYHVRKRQRHKRKRQVPLAQGDAELKEWQAAARGKVQAGSLSARKPPIIVVESKATPRNAKATPLKIVICGPPAGGKGTQCELLVKSFGVVHLSTGDMLRAAIHNGSNVGRQAKEYMEAGQLVPDDLIVGVIMERLQQSDCVVHGWLLDGFPRTETQAQAMIDAGIVPDIVLVLDVPDEQVVARISGRRVDLSTGKTYHIEWNPPPPDVAIVQRSDDNEETIRVRLSTYHANCGAVVDAFEPLSSIVHIDGMLDKAAIAATIHDAVSGKASGKLAVPESARTDRASSRGRIQERHVKKAILRQAAATHAKPAAPVEMPKVSPKHSKHQPQPPSQKKSPRAHKASTDSRLVKAYSPPRPKPAPGGGRHDEEMTASYGGGGDDDDDDSVFPNIPTDEPELSKALHRAMEELGREQAENDRLKQLFLDRGPAKNDSRPRGLRELDVALEQLLSERKSLVRVTKRQKESIDANEWDALLQRTTAQLDVMRRKVQQLKRHAAPAAATDEDAQFNALHVKHAQLKAAWRQLSQPPSTKDAAKIAKLRKKEAALQRTDQEYYTAKATHMQQYTKQEVERMQAEMKQLQDALHATTAQFDTCVAECAAVEVQLASAATAANALPKLGKTKAPPKLVLPDKPQFLQSLPPIQKPHTGDMAPPRKKHPAMPPHHTARDK